MYRNKTVYGNTCYVIQPCKTCTYFPKIKNGYPIIYNIYVYRNSPYRAPPTVLKSPQNKNFDSKQRGKTQVGSLWPRLRYFAVFLEEPPFPAELKSGLFSILANGLLGLGSSGVPSTRLQSPTMESQPTTVQQFGHSVSANYQERFCKKSVVVPEKNFFRIQILGSLTLN